MSKRLAYSGIVFLLGVSLTARAQESDDAWHVKGDRGETVKVLPPQGNAGDAPGHPVYAPISGFAVYPASYGSGKLVDHGGLEIANAGFYQIFYNGSTYDANTATGINGFVGAFGSGVADYTIIQQYGSHATIAPTLANAGVYDDSAGVPASITDTQVQQYLAGLFGANKVTPNAFTVYGVYLPAGTVSKLGTASSCTNYCGYHSVFTYSGTQIKYAVFPWLTCSGCSLSGRSVLDMLTIVTSHEIREAVTDPGDNGVDAWYDRRGYEADDKCAWHHLYQMTTGGYWVQPEYSNANGGCVVP
jgi:hypothetical protein